MTKQIFQDRIFRKRLARQLDAIVTFSDYDTIFGQRTIRISNGIDFDNVTMKETANDTSKELNLIGVAEIHKWHGFDRLVKGLTEYYSRPQDYTVRFHVVGYFYSEEGEQEFLLKSQVEALQLRFRRKFPDFAGNGRHNRSVLVFPELECIDIFHLPSNSLMHQEKAAASLLSPSWK